MMRKLTRNYSLGVIAASVAILALLIAAAVRAQVPSADRLSGKATAVLAQAGSSASAQAERPLIPWTVGAGRFPVGRSQTKRDGASPADSNPPLFLPAVNYRTGGYQYSFPTSVATADVNGDGKPDLVVVNGSDVNSPPEGTVGVLLGNGDGTFQPAVAYGTGGTGPTWVAIADVNGDGKPDLIVANSNQCPPSSCGDGTVSVLLGNGDGTFQTPVSYDAGGIAAESVAVADVNGDGKPDLVVTTFSGCVGVLLGNGDGTFQPVVTYCFRANLYAVAVGDFNGDGKPDLVVTTNSSGGVFVFLNNGDGTFPSFRAYGTGGLPHSVAVADVNGDGNLDLVVANAAAAGNLPNTVAVLLGNGDGTFQLREVLDSGGYYWATAVAVADVNRDGAPDIMVASVSSHPNYSAEGVIGVLLNKGNGTFYAAEKYDVVQPTASTMVAADLNGDGWPDLAVGGGDLGLMVLLNTAGRVPSGIKMSTSGTPSFVGQPVTITAAVTSKYGTIPNGELVTFYDGSASLGSVALAGGTAAYTTSSLSVKTHTIEATYLGDATFLPSTGKVTQVVDKDPTTTALTSSPNPSAYGQAVTFTATVTPTGPYQPTGSVTFKNGSKTLGSGTLNAGGVATLTTAKIPVGANTLTSTYSGDALNGKSASAAITQTVSQASVSMVLTSTPNPSTFGRSVKFTATLTSNGGVPSGQPVTFSYNSATLGTAIVSATGVATFSTTTLPQGSDAVTAAYAGSVDYSSASATVTQVVN